MKADRYLPVIPRIEDDIEGWLAWKRRRISGHDASTLCGVNAYQTTGQLFDRIVHGVVDQKTAEDERFLRWRLKMEKNVADEYVEQTGRTIRSIGSRYHKDNPRIVSSVDREILKDDRGVGLLEIKTRDPMVWQRLKLSGCPDQDFAQLQHYLWVNDRSWGELCEANVSTGKQIIVRLNADLEFQKVLKVRIDDFLAACDRGERPAEAAVDPVRMPKVAGELVTVDQMDAALAKDFRDVSAALIGARYLRDQANEYHDLAKGAMQRLLRLHGIDVAEGFGVRVYYKEQAGRATFDKKALLKDHPKIDIEKYTKRGAPYRTLRVYKRPLSLTGGAS